MTVLVTDTAMPHRFRWVQAWTTNNVIGFILFIHALASIAAESRAWIIDYILFDEIIYIGHNPGDDLALLCK